MPPAIDIQNLSHSYGPRTALSNLTLAIPQNEIFSLLGPNGSGKTTLFRLLSTLIAPQAGEICFNFPPDPVLVLHPSSVNAIRRHIGVVFQSPSLDKQLTAEENLRHHGHLYGLCGRELQSRIDNLLERFGLADRRREYLQTFSGGMRRRVEIAKGLLSRPKLLLMDEPSTGLDPAARIELWKTLRDLQQNEKLTILLTTHLMDEADRSDRLAILDAGRLVASGTPGDLKDGIGADVITLVSHDLAALRSALLEKMGLSVDQLDNALRIELPRAHEAVPRIVEAAPALIESVSVGKPTLEDVFIRATGRRFTSDAAAPITAG